MVVPNTKEAPLPPKQIITTLTTGMQANHHNSRTERTTKLTSQEFKETPGNQDQPGAAPIKIRMGRTTKVATTTLLKVAVRCNQTATKERNTEAAKLYTAESSNNETVTNKIHKTESKNG